MSYKCNQRGDESSITSWLTLKKIRATTCEVSSLLIVEIQCIFNMKIFKCNNSRRKNHRINLFYT